jgi:hypothetical protein
MGHMGPCVTFFGACLRLRSNCHLDADSLQPLAQLRNLKALLFFHCSGLTTSCMELFLRAAVQGNGLEVQLYPSASGSCGEREEEVKEIHAMYHSLVHSLGAKNVPLLRCG